MGGLKTKRRVNNLNSRGRIVKIMKEKHREVSDIINNKKYKLQKIMSTIIFINIIDMPWIDSGYLRNHYTHLFSDP